MSGSFSSFVTAVVTIPSNAIGAGPPMCYFNAIQVLKTPDLRYIIYKNIFQERRRRPPDERFDRSSGHNCKRMITYFETNVIGTTKLLEIARKHNIRMH
jgi:hypothetical protein